MSSKERNAEKRREWAAQQETEFRARKTEEERKAGLDMYMRIFEADASDDVKDILHRIAIHVGLET